VRRFHARHRVAIWLIVVALVVAAWVVFLYAGHGTVSGGSG
jgi:hypothetical protein